MPPEGGIADDDQGTGSDEPVDIADVLEKFDAEAAAELETASTKAAAEEGSGKGKGGAAPRAASDSDDPIDRFVTENYNGNREAAVSGFYESRVENRRLVQELETLRQQVEKPAPTVDLAAELETRRKSDPDVQALNRDITETSERNKAIQARQVSIVAAADKLSREVEVLDAEVSFIDDPKEANKKMAEANRKRAELVTLTNEYNTNELRLEKNSDKITSQQRELRRTEQALEARLAEEAKASQANEKGGVLTRRSFDAAFTYYTEPLKIDPKSEQGKFAYSAIKAQLADHLDSLGEADGLDAHGIFEVTKDLVEKYARAHNLKVGAAPKSPSAPSPRRVLTPPAPTGARADAAALRGNKATEAVLSNPDMVRRRAAAIDQALASRRRANG